MAAGDAYVFPGFLTPVLTLLFFQSHRLLFSHASAEVRGENTPERKVASTWDRTHNHQVMSPTRSPLSHPGGLSSVTAFNLGQSKISVWLGVTEVQLSLKGINPVAIIFINLLRKN